MFDNVSQGLFLTGGTGYLIVVPVLRGIATVLMVVSIYNALKINSGKYKWGWVFFTCLSPIITRIVYEIYSRWTAKKENRVILKPKHNTALLILSVVLFVVSAVLSFVSIISMGLGFIKSYVDNEPIAAVYDVYGNECFDYMEVPLYDREGNVYTYEPAWFVVGDYVDQNGNALDGERCYLSQDGFLYYDEHNTLKPYKTYEEYYTDGNQIYYDLWGYVYWDADGVVYGQNGRYSIELFDFEDER